MSAAAAAPAAPRTERPGAVEVYRDDGPPARALFRAVSRRGRPPGGRLAWAVPPLVRLVEYGGLVAIAALEGASALPAAFALLCALAFRHYDLVYRLRHRGETPPAWVNALAGGWEVRLLAAALLLAVGALPEAYWVAAAVYGAVFAGESAAGWATFSRARRPILYEDAEDEGQ
jgi:hypothetical protein